MDADGHDLTEDGVAGLPHADGVRHAQAHQAQAHVRHTVLQLLRHQHRAVGRKVHFSKSNFYFK